MGSTLIILSTLFCCFFRNPCQQQSTDRNNTCVLSVFLDHTVKLRILISSNQLIPLTEFAGYVDSILLPCRLSPYPTMLIARRRWGSI
jgi:hypothetical protein